MTDLTNRNFFAEFIGSAWNHVYAGSRLTGGVASFSASAVIQQYQWMIEAVERLSINTVKPTSLEFARPVIFRQSNFSVGPDKLYQGGGQVFGAQPSDTEFQEGALFAFGGLEKKSGKYYVGIDSSAVSIGPVIINSLRSPSLVWVDGIDFTFADGIIAFKKNPFDDPRIPKRKVASDADGEDEDEIVLWMTNVQSDSGEFSQHYGFAAPGLKPGTDEYFGAVKACLRAITEGPTMSAIDHLVAATLGLPCILEARETVLSIVPFGDDTVVATDLGIYLVKSDFSVRQEVVAGAVLEAGHPLCDGSEVFDRTSKRQWWAELDGLLLGESFFDHRIKSAVGFINSTYPVILGASRGTEDGKDLRTASFFLAGRREDVDLFWSISENSAAQTGRYLGNELYVQRGVVDEGGLPDFSTQLLINPLQFLAESVIRDSVIVVRIRNSSKLPMTSLFQIIGLIKDVIPPWLGLVVVADIQVDDAFEFHLNNNPANSMSGVEASDTRAILGVGGASLEQQTALDWAALESDGTPTSRIHEAVSIDRSPDLLRETISFGDPSGNVASYGQSFSVCEESVEPHPIPVCTQ